MSNSRVIAKEPCPKCGSRDNLNRYDDGHAHCFGEGCGYREKGDGTPTAAPKTSKTALRFSGEVLALPSRLITEETARLFQYRYGRITDKEAHLAYYLDDKRQPIAAKVRFADKSFRWIGNPKEVGLYGQWLWPRGGRKVIVTEGEIDCLTVSQLQENKWPVVSVPNGATAAPRDIKHSLDWLSAFDEVILMFDMDEPGQSAAQKCAELFEPGKAKIAMLPFKDANECLKNGKGDEVVRAIWNAKAYRPDGIIDGSELWDDLANDTQVASIPYPWECLNEKTHGIRQSELITLTAGTGIGKSAVVREIAKSITDKGQRIGMLMLEEGIKQTAFGLMGLHLNKRLNVSRTDVSKEDMHRAFLATVGSGNVYLYDHFGSSAVDRLLSRVRHMARALDCKYIFLDHLSIIVSSMEEDGDERKLIDRAMTLLRTLVQETGICLFVVSHLKRPEGKGHEEGAHTSLSQLRGSHAIAQLSDIVIGLERNQQGDNPNETVLRILKNRFSGETGESGSLFYDNDTGRLTEVEQVTEGEQF